VTSDGVILRRGEPWGRPAGGPPDLEVTGDDAALARAVEHARKRGGSAPLVRFRPEASSFARAVGLPPGAAPATAGLALPVDALDVEAGEHYGRRLAVNGVVLGVPPDRLRGRHALVPVAVTCDGRPLAPAEATTVAVLNGQFLDDLDVAPRGHPGDGRAEVVVLAVTARDRKAMRQRMARGDHLPHPGITVQSARRVRVEWASEQSIEVDGHPVGRRRVVEIAVLAQAFELLV
jgi:diacylglycerol kinase family enzyme